MAHRVKTIHVHDPQSQDTKIVISDEGEEVSVEASAVTRPGGSRIPISSVRTSHVSLSTTEQDSEIEEPPFGNIVPDGLKYIQKIFPALKALTNNATSHVDSFRSLLSEDEPDYSFCYLIDSAGQKTDRFWAVISFFLRENHYELKKPCSSVIICGEADPTALARSFLRHLLKNYGQWKWLDTKLPKEITLTTSRHFDNRTPTRWTHLIVKKSEALLAYHLEKISPT